MSRPAVCVYSRMKIMIEKKIDIVCYDRKQEREREKRGFVPFSSPPLPSKVGSLSSLAYEVANEQTSRRRSSRRSLLLLLLLLLLFLCDPR